jgi:hypothetical protein
MGLFLDTVEDNDEASGWKVEVRRQLLGIPQPPPRNFASLNCPQCDLSFFSSSELNDHFFEEHRHKDRGKNNDGRNSEQKFLEIDQSQLILIEEEMLLLQSRIDKNDRSVDYEWHRYGLRLDQSFQGQYLGGILEYLRAHDLEVNRYSTNRTALSENFYRAYNKLLPFQTAMAQQICQAIALKMNWFGEYKETPDSSLFCLAWHFFTQNYEEVSKINSIPIASNMYQRGIILDEFHSELLEIIKFYYSDRSALNHNRLCKLEVLLNEVSNENYASKLALLKARLYREWREFNQAKECYSVIRNHDKFGLEAGVFSG